MLVPKPIVGKILRGEATLAYRPATTRRPRLGERLYVKARQRDEVACHVTVIDVEDRLLGAVTFEDARAMGWKTTSDFKADWVARHDASWVARQGELIEDLDDAYALTDEEIAARFDTRWTRSPVHVIRFVLDTSEQPIMLMQGSPLTDGGKARLMSNRKIPPGRATSTAITGPEEHGYTQSGPRAMPREPEPVDASTQKLYAREGHQGWAARELAREADRERLGLEERLRLARSEARAAGIDVARQEASILSRIRALESKVRKRT